MKRRSRSSAGSPKRCWLWSTSMNGPRTQVTQVTQGPQGAHDRRWRTRRQSVWNISKTEQQIQSVSWQFDGFVFSHFLVVCPCKGISYIYIYTYLNIGRSHPMCVLVSVKGPSCEEDRKMWSRKPFVQIQGLGFGGWFGTWGNQKSPPKNHGLTPYKKQKNGKDLKKTWWFESQTKAKHW